MTVNITNKGNGKVSITKSSEKVISTENVQETVTVKGGARGETGPQGPQGIQGIQGETGEPGIVQGATPPVDTDVLWADTTEAGDAVIPVGGTTGQALVKVSNDDYDTGWSLINTGAPTGAQYVTMSNDSGLSNERVLTAGTGITISDGGAGAAVTVSTSAILPSVIDAKGDLLVGTNADTVSRLPVGTINGQVLTVDSSQTAGVKWSNAPETFPSVGYVQPTGWGTVYSAPGWVISTSTNTGKFLSSGSYNYWPIFLSSATVLNNIGLKVTAAGSAGSVIRAGFVSADQFWKPQSLIYDAGTTSASLGVKDFPVPNISLSAGRYLIVLGTNSTSAVTLYGFNGTFIYNSIVYLSNSGNNQIPRDWYVLRGGQDCSLPFANPPQAWDSIAVASSANINVFIGTSP